MAKKTTYYDPAGKKQTGYVIDGKTYADETGTQRVGVGSVVLGDSGKAWQLTDSGGVRVNPGLLTKAGSSADYSAQAAKILQKINNGEKFNTDLVGDPLMQQYRDLYIGNGQRAMQDTIGQAAALTGGYGSSYAQNAGQQAYNEWLRNLNDKALDIYQLRRNEYDKDRAALYDQLSALNSAAATEYSKERDALADERYADELAYSRGRDTISDERYADETAYNRQQDALALEASSRKDAYSRAVSMIESGYMPTDEELAAAGISKGYAQYMVALAQQQASGGSSGGGSGGSNRGGGGTTQQNVDGHLHSGVVRTVKDYYDLSDTGKAIFRSVPNVQGNELDYIYRAYQQALNNGKITEEQYEEERNWWLKQYGLEEA